MTIKECLKCERPWAEHTTTQRGEGTSTLTVTSECPIEPIYDVVQIGQVMTLDRPANEGWEFHGEPTVYVIPPGGDHADPLAEEYVIGAKVMIRRRRIAA